MAYRMCIAVVLAALMVAGASAQMDCTMAMTSLTPCYAYVTGPATTPTEVCCNGISNVNTNSPDCLCQLIAQMDANPAVNATKAYSLPRDCNVAVDTSKCPAFNAPPIAFNPPPLTMPPGLSAPPMPAAPPMDITMPPGMPPVSIPPTVFTPPSAPMTPPAEGPVAGGPAPVAGGEEPVSGPGASPANGGSSPAPAPVTAGASMITASMVFAAALTGAVFLVL